MTTQAQPNQRGMLHPPAPYDTHTDDVQVVFIGQAAPSYLERLSCENTAALVLNEENDDFDLDERC